jgi:SAM-dependent methyltransferase
VSGSNLCPHCGAKMDPITTPLDSSWGGETHYVCFNDECCYFVNSWQIMGNQGIEGAGYRCRIDPRGIFGPVAVISRDDLKMCIIRSEPKPKGTLDYFAASDFVREDETPDPEFYRTMRFPDHLDSLALATVEDLFAQQIPKGSRILDLMAGAQSYLRAELEPAAVTGLGLNEQDLQENPVLTERIIHDLNAVPLLPFNDNEFDVVVNTISVDYMTRPIEVFREVSRILKPNGLLIVVFSNRMFPPKAVNIWKSTIETDRVDLVKKYFSAAERFYFDGVFESKGKPRPKDDPYYSLGIPSDPIYAVSGKVVK